MMTKSTYWLAVPTVIGLLLTTACGTSRQPPTESIATAESAISLAKDSNAYEYAARDLRSAEDKLQQAKDAVQREEYDDAQRLAEKALIEAKLAKAKADASGEHDATEKMRESVEKFDQDVNR